MPRLPRSARALAVLGFALAGCSPGVTTPDQGTTTTTGATAGATNDRYATTVRVRACDGPAASLPPALAAQLPARDSARPNFDDYLAGLARRVPGGFAGVYYAEAGTRPVLLLTDTSRAAEAKRALAGELRGFDLASAEARPARWDFAQLLDWRRYLEVRHLWVGATGVTAVDTDERANRVYFGAADQAARDRLAERIGAVEGLPCDLVLVGVSPPAVAW